MKVTAHEEYNYKYSPDEYIWTYSPEIRTHDTYTWRLETESNGVAKIEGEIKIKINKILPNFNLLEYLPDNSSLEAYEDKLDELFTVEFSEHISYYSETYPVDYFIVPIIFKTPNNPKYNIFEQNFNRNEIFVSLINDTIDSACVQGCHIEKNAPFKTESCTDDIKGDTYIISGVYAVKDFPGAVAYNYEKGTFQAEYDIETGFLNSWSWISEDKTDMLSIERTKFSKVETKVLFVSGFIGTGMLVLIIWMYVRTKRNS